MLRSFLQGSEIGIQILTANDGSAVLLIDFGNEGLRFYEEESLSVAQNSIVHEYFHILRGQLASGFAQLPDGKVVYDLGQGPFWLVEGTAQYADYVYSPRGRVGGLFLIESRPTRT